MKPKTLILMVVAVGCGLAASYMTSKLLADRRQEAPVEENVDILTAKVKVPQFTVIKEPDKFFEVRKFRKSDAPKSYFSSPEDVRGKRVTKDLKADVFVSPEDIQTASAQLPTPDGYGAISVTVTAASSVTGFVQPGDRVDIILTQAPPNASSQTILSDILVVAAGDRAHRTGDGEGPRPINTVTVALNIEDSQKIRLAEKLGELSLFIRNPADTNKRPAKVTTIGDLRRIGVDLGSSGTTPEPVARGTGSNELPPIPETTPKKDQDPPTVKDPPKDPTPVVVTQPKVEEEQAIRPSWTIRVSAGASPTRLHHFYKRPDGSVTHDETDPTLKGTKKKTTVGE
jgi:pilus assembly protein CpaB